MIAKPMSKVFEVGNRYHFQLLEPDRILHCETKEDLERLLDHYSMPFIKLRLPDVAIVMLTISRDDADLFESLQVGASGYLLKDRPPARLPAALLGVLDGEAPLPRSLTARLIEEFRSRERSRALKNLLRARDVRLSQREWEVLELLGQGLITSEIADRLNVAAPTVRSHVHGILKKLRVPDRKSTIRLLQGRAELPAR